MAGRQDRLVAHTPQAVQVFEANGEADRSLALLHQRGSALADLLERHC